MEPILLLAGRIAGALGALLTIVAVLPRVLGHYWLGGFALGTLLQAGIAAMVLGCVCFLWVLTGRR